MRAPRHTKTMLALHRREASYWAGFCVRSGRSGRSGEVDWQLGCGIGRSLFSMSCRGSYSVRQVASRWDRLVDGRTLMMLCCLLACLLCLPALAHHGRPGRPGRPSLSLVITIICSAPQVIRTPVVASNSAQIYIGGLPTSELPYLRLEYLGYH